MFVYWLVSLLSLACLLNLFESCCLALFACFLVLAVWLLGVLFLVVCVYASVHLFDCLLVCPLCGRARYCLSILLFDCLFACLFACLVACLIE